MCICLPAVKSCLHDHAEIYDVRMKSFFTLVVILFLLEHLYSIKNYSFFLIGFFVPENYKENLP